MKDLLAAQKAKALKSQENARKRQEAQEAAKNKKNEIELAKQAKI